MSRSQTKPLPSKSQMTPEVVEEEEKEEISVGIQEEAEKEIQEEAAAENVEEGLKEAIAETDLKEAKEAKDLLTEVTEAKEVLTEVLQEKKEFFLNHSLKEPWCELVALESFPDFGHPRFAIIQLCDTLEETYLL